MLGYPDDVVAAAVLHDVLEDTDAERGGLEARFGLMWPISSRSSATTRRSPTRRSARTTCGERARRAGGYAPVVYAPDKISKVREFRSLVHAGLERSQAEAKLERHRRSLAMLEQVTPASRLTEALRFEIDAFERLPPATEANRGTGATVLGSGASGRGCDDAKSAGAHVGQRDADHVEVHAVLELDELAVRARDDADDAVEEDFVREVHVGSSGSVVSAKGGLRRPRCTTLECDDYPGTSLVSPRSPADVRVVNYGDRGIGRP